MFGKSLKVQGSIRLKDKDLEGFITNLKKSFDSYTIDKIFEDSEECLQEKLIGSKMIIYHMDEYPAFVDGTGKDDYVPSLYVVSEYPQLIGTIILKQGLEETAIKAGKILWTQVSNIDKLGDFKKDDIKKIISADKKLLAIGAIGCDSADIKKEQMKGIAAYVLHKIGDKLWEHGAQELTPPKEVEDFESVQYINTQNYEILSDEDVDLQILTQGLKKEGKKTGKHKPAQKVNVPVPVQKQQQQQKQKQEESESDSDDNRKQSQNTKKNKQKQQQPTDQLLIPLKVMDQYIKEAFFNAIKIGITDKQLPIEGQAFYDKYMLLYKRDNIELDLKNSTFQKIGKFLQQMNKDGLIEYKETKKGQPHQIVKIDRSNDLYDEWDPTVQKGKQKQEYGEHQVQQSYKPCIEINELYLPQGPILPIFQKGEQQIQPLTKDQYRQQLNQYLKEKCKAEKKMYILTDQILSQMGIIEQEEEIEITDEMDDNKKKEILQQKQDKQKKEDGVSIDAIQKKVEDYMLKTHQIKNLRTNVVELRQSEFKGLQIIAEKSHNQPVNRIIGLETFGFSNQAKPEDIYSFAYLVQQLTEKFHCQVQLHDIATGKQKQHKEKEKEVKQEIKQQTKQDNKKDKKQKGTKKEKQPKQQKKQKEQQIQESESESDSEQEETLDNKQQLTDQQVAQIQSEKVVPKEGEKPQEKVHKQLDKEIIIMNNVYEELNEYLTNIVKIDAKYIRGLNKLVQKKKPEQMTRQ